MIDLRIKSLFFDRAKVVDALDRATRRALARIGAFIRQRAKTSIRSRKGSAPPGQPPHAHTGLLRRFILFGYDPATRSVVIGPAKLNRSTAAPSVLEFGGQTTVESYRSRRGQVRRVRRRVTVEARPYMGPALEKECAHLPRQWAHSVRG